jgi:predicted nucleotide-binding protein (sugar kinase/HSP70/actin superfamily)
MFRFLELEGAQLLVEPIATWVSYLIHQAKQKTIDRKGLIKEENTPRWWEIMKRLRISKAYFRKLVLLSLAEKILKREYNRLRGALGLMGYGITDQHELQQIAHPYYNSRVTGGEGHLEVAKNIYYQNKDLCHMVLSLKPFGCMPSTQSDAVQATVINHYKDMIYLPIETSGEGEINAHSRVQMALADAKIKAEEEFQEVLSETGLTIEKVKIYVERHPELKRPMYTVPHYNGTIGVAANFVRHVADLMRTERVMIKQGISSSDKLNAHI